MIPMSLVAQSVKNLPAMQETWVQSLPWEDPLEWGMAMHSSILAWGIPTHRDAWRATVHGAAKRRRPLSNWTAQHRTPRSHASCRNVSIAVATRWRARVTGPSLTQLWSQPPSLLCGSHWKVPFSDGNRVKEAGGETAITMFFLSIQRSTMQELKGTRAGRWFYCQMSLTWCHVNTSWLGLER